MPPTDRMSDERLAEIETTYRPINGQGEWADAHRVINQLLAEVKRLRDVEGDLRNALMVSEDYRRAYCKGKYELYALSEEVREAAVKHLPGGSEGPLDRYTQKVEREHSPLLVKGNAELVRQLNVAEAEVAELRKDAARLEWLCQTEAYMAHSKDGDDCHLIWPFNSFDEEDGSTTIQGGNFGSHRASIDAGMAVLAKGGVK